MENDAACLHAFCLQLQQGSQASMNAAAGPISHDIGILCAQLTVLHFDRTQCPAAAANHQVTWTYIAHLVRAALPQQLECTRLDAGQHNCTGPKRAESLFLRGWQRNHTGVGL